MNYRPEIDGLRAIAVVAIVLFHTEISLFDKAFIGVDVFFVISGYLITGLIVHKQQTANFVLVDFYLRRIRRLLPVLLLLMLVCIPFAHTWMLAVQFKDFSQSLIATTTFSSNILFWLKSQYYFAESSSFKPLLHTWSLAIEEQFYLFYPVLLLPLLQWGKRYTVYLVSIVTFMSAAYAEWYLAGDLISQYYLPQARVWLFGIGALVFFTCHRKQLVTDRFAASLAIIGASMFLLPIILASNNLFFEHRIGVLSWTSISIAGVAMMIAFASQHNMVGRLLSLRLLVAIGLISYSLYLWHYPIFALARIRLFEVSASEYFGLTMLALMLAFLSWRWVETPFRNAKLVNTKRLLVTVCSASLVILSIGVYGVLSGGVVLGISSETDSALRDNYGLSKNCSPFNSSLSASNGVCQTGAEPEIALWGDSFAMHIVDGLLASNPKASLIQFTLSACSPVPMAARISPTNLQYKQRVRQCAEFNRLVLASLDHLNSVNYAIVSSRFSNHFTRYYAQSSHYTADQKVSGEQGLLRTVTHDFQQVLENLTNRGITPVVISEPARPPDANIVCAASSVKLGRDIKPCNFSRSTISEAQVSANKLLLEIAKDYNVIWLDEVLCNGDKCFTVLEQTPIFTSGGHLSRQGSALIGKKLDLYKRLKKVR